MNESSSPSSTGPSDSPSSGESRRAKCLDPQRIELVRTQRALSSGLSSLIMPRGLNKCYAAMFTIQPPNIENIFMVKRGLTPIVLDEMDPWGDDVYDGRLLALTIIENPGFGFTAANFLAEDDNGKAIRLCVYEVPQDEKTATRFAFGTRVGIINPYHRMALDGGTAIRVDDPKTIIPLGGKIDMCRYCGMENSVHRCSKCKVTYCSRECQIGDWKKMNHKIICN